MKTNLDTIQEVIEYIDAHLEERLDLDSLCKVAGYSKYHLGRMFSNVVGFSIHTYIQRRRLTEAARLLILTNKSIMDIALFAGSLQPVANYIYKEWFPQSTCQLNENAKYDFARYGEDTDENGKSIIEYWVPI